MTERELFDATVLGWFGLSAVMLVILWLVKAPYGRHARPGFGPDFPPLAGWILMEIPAVITLPICFVIGDRHDDPAAIVFLILWEAHYLNRTFVYPLRRRGTLRPLTASVAVPGFFTNFLVNYLNGRWVFEFGPRLGAEWLTDPRFLLGVAMFVGGFALNVHSDEILRKLRKPGETGYVIPRGGGYRWVSCPNYLGELIEWFGWALATWSLPGLAFAVWSASNLIPRSWHHHRWYRERFDDYPRERRAVLPYLL